MARLTRVVRDRLLSIRNVPITLYGMVELFFGGGGSHGYSFPFIMGRGPATFPRFAGAEVFSGDPPPPEDPPPPPQTFIPPPAGDPADTFDGILFDLVLS